MHRIQGNMRSLKTKLKYTYLIVWNKYNHRIKNIAKGKVTFSYKDYAQGSAKRNDAGCKRILRRFCLHILPKGFKKIRHYGFLASRSRPKLKMHQMQMGIIPAKAKKDWKTIAKEKLHFDVEQCPCCKTGKMITLLTFEAHGPPLLGNKKMQRATARECKSLMRGGNVPFSMIQPSSIICHFSHSYAHFLS